jgi:hypothetical protein
LPLAAWYGVMPLAQDDNKSIEKNACKTIALLPKMFGIVFFTLFLLVTSFHNAGSSKRIYPTKIIFAFFR